MDDKQLTSWTTYQAAWAAISDEERRSMLEASIVPNVVYTDPSSISHGYDELASKMQATQESFPGARFRNDKFQAHHRQAVSRWTMLDGSGQPIYLGVSYARFANDARLESMIGFFEPVS
jgi:hypothetical protein